MIKYKNKKFFSYIKTLQVIKIINYYNFLKQLNIIFKKIEKLNFIYNLFKINFIEEMIKNNWFDFYE